MQETVVRFTEFRDGLGKFLRGNLDGTNEGAIAILYRPRGSIEEARIAGYLLSEKEYHRYANSPTELFGMGDFDTPAILYRSEHYPKEWGDRVPAKIRITRTVREQMSEGLGIDCLLLPTNGEYECWVNSHGVVYAWIGVENNRRKVQLNSYEFEVTEWVKK